ncbi:MAG: hypothetical protein B7Y41_03575 [Hydrogenophilales bacterium 28-61-23]|nr:MAG: hypothetical protein B7Y41_03575 [Hydrogenophilales bacterium 28-61-23]
MSDTVSGIAAAAIGMRQSLLASNVQMAVLKTSIEAEAQAVLQLLEGAAQTTSNPPHLGNRLDTTA